MDKQLQHRLLGAVVVVALTVIFVPELVHQPQHSATQSTASDNEQTTVIAMAKPSPATSTVNTKPAASAQSSNTPTSQSPGPATAAAAPGPAPVVAKPSVPATGTEQTTSQTQQSGHQQEPQQSVTPPVTAQRSAAQRRQPEQQRPPQQQHQTVQRQAPQAEQQSRAEHNRATRRQQTAEKSPRVSPSRSGSSATEKAPKLPPIRLIGEPMTDYRQQLAQRKQQRSATRPAQTQAQVEQPRWMVQVGSFSEVKHAEELRDRLQAHHFAAVLTRARVDGKTLYRVRIGPHSTRAAGEHTRQRLESELGINGALVPVYR